MNIEQARFNMIEQQIRPWDVLDPEVLELLHVVKRENFVPVAHKALAFADIEIPLPGGEAMLAPKIEARLLQDLGLKKHESVLEIGTGAGYLTAPAGAQGAPRDFGRDFAGTEGAGRQEPGRQRRHQRHRRTGQWRPGLDQRRAVRRDRGRRLAAGAAGSVVATIESRWPSGRHHRPARRR